MPVIEPALLRAFPGLAPLPRLPLLDSPTPVEPLPLDGQGDEQLWIKRDERSALGYGGNKPRKLEFLLGNALAHGARRLITTGGLGTHHGLATTIFGRLAGLETTLVLVRQPWTEHVRETLLLQAAFGADQVYAGNLPGAALQVLRVLARSTLAGERPWLVPTGGSSWRGSAGFISAALELAEQVRAGDCPAPAEVFVAVGTGGTLAGLVAGFALARLPVRVVGVLVTDILPPSRRALHAAASRALRRLQRIDPNVPSVGIRPDAIEIVTRQRGPGYGAATPEARDAVRAAEACGVAAETTYTGKCLAEIRARRAEGRLAERPALYWNTLNAIDVRAVAPRIPEPGLLPPRLRALFESEGS